MNTNMKQYSKMLSLPKKRFKLPPIHTTSDDLKRPSLMKYDNSTNYNSKAIEIEKTTITTLINKAICNLAKGFYNLALKDALKTIDLDSSFSKGYYIASLAYLEMHEVEKAEKLIKDNSNKRLISLIQKKKEEQKKKKRSFKLYEAYLNFAKELYRKDAYFPKIDIHFYSDDNRGVISKSFITKNEIIMIIPKKCLISLEVAMTTKIGREIVGFMYSELLSPKHCLLAAFILTEENNKKWKFYFDMMPKDYSNFPFYYKDKEIALLKGSPFVAQIIEKRTDMKRDYDQLCTLIPSFSQFTYKKYCEARIIISSRIFGVSINYKKTDVLVPYADMLNHKRPRQTHWYYDDSVDGFVIQAMEDIPEGREIFDSYGKKCNSRFLMNYGFVMEDNEANEYPLSISFDENCPSYEEKKALVSNDFLLNKKFRIGLNFFESQVIDLFSYLRFMMFDGDMNLLMTIISNNQNTIFEEMIPSFYYVEPITKELEISVLKEISRLCLSALAEYPTTEKEDQEILNTTKSLTFNERNCIILRMSEKKILMFFIDFCQYCLHLLSFDKQIDVINTFASDFKYEECLFEYYIDYVILRLVEQ